MPAGWRSIARSGLRPGRHRHTGAFVATGRLVCGLPLMPPISDQSSALRPVAVPIRQ